MKENDLVHGEWEKWCKDVIKMSPAMARKHIKVFEENNVSESYRSLTNDFSDNLEKLYDVATMPEEEREKPHTVPSTGVTKTVDEMTKQKNRLPNGSPKSESSYRSYLLY